MMSMWWWLCCVESDPNKLYTCVSRESSIMHWRRNSDTNDVRLRWQKPFRKTNCFEDVSKWIKFFRLCDCWSSSNNCWPVWVLIVTVRYIFPIEDLKNWNISICILNSDLMMRDAHYIQVILHCKIVSTSSLSIERSLKAAELQQCRKVNRRQLTNSSL